MKKKYSIIKKWQNRTLLQMTPKISAIFGAPLLFVAFFLLPFFVHASVDAKEATNLGLVSYWSLNEGTSTIAHDFSGNGNNGILLNTPTWVAGKRGEALNFSGTAYVQDISGSNLPTGATAPFTLSGWEKATVYNSLSFLFGFGEQMPSGSGLGDMRGVLEFNNDYYFWGGGADWDTGIPFKTDGLWHHVTFAANSTTIFFYLDGVLAASGTRPAGLTTAQTYITAGNRHSSGSTYFQGSLDEVRIYNRLLSATEITTLYKSGVAKITTANTTSGSPLAVNTEDNKLTKGLVGLWSFNTPDMSGTTAIDKSGQGHNGTLTNGPTAVAGKVGQALSLNSASKQYVAVPAPGWVLSSATFSGWIYSNANQSNYSGIVYSRNSTNAPGWGLSYGATPVTNQLGYQWNSTEYLWASGLVVPNNKWTFVSLVVTPTGATMYMGTNGSLQHASVATAESPETFNGEVDIGWDSCGNGGACGAPNRAFNGIMDETRVYNRALSTSEIQELYQTGLVTINAPETNRSLTGLVGYWTFDGKNTVWTSTTAGTVTDSSGNGNTGTLTNLNQQTSPVAGRVGQAMNFNGTNQYVDMGTPSSLNITGNAVTVSAWVYAADTSNYRGIASNINSAVTQGYFLGVGSTVAFDVTIGGVVSSVQSTSPLTLNKWQYVVGVYDGAHLSIYVNGVLSSTPVALTGNITSSSAHFFIGRNSYTGAQSYWDGDIDEVRVYNRALSASEIKQLYLAGSL